MLFCLFPRGPIVKAEARRRNKHGSYRLVDSMVCGRDDLEELLPGWVVEVYETHIGRQTVLTSLVGGTNDAYN